MDQLQMHIHLENRLDQVRDLISTFSSRIKTKTADIVQQ